VACVILWYGINRRVCYESKTKTLNRALVLMDVKP
jgi:hypothetical protein